MLKVKVESVDTLTCSTVTTTNGLMAADSLHLMKPPDPGGADDPQSPTATDHDQHHEDKGNETTAAMGTNQEETAYTIEEGQAETTEVPSDETSAMNVESTAMDDVVIEDESPVMVMSSTETQDGLSVQEVVEVPYLQGPSGGVIVLEEEGTTQYIITDGNTEYLTEEVSESSGLLQDEHVPIEGDKMQQLGMFEQVVPTNHVVVERIQYHEVPFIPPHVGGDAVVVSQEDEMSDGDEGDHYRGIKTEDGIPGSSLESEQKMLYSLQSSGDVDLQEPTISGQTRALLIQRLAGRLQHEQPDVVLKQEPATQNGKAKTSKKSKRKNSGGNASERNMKKKKVCKPDVNKGKTLVSGQLSVPTLVNPVSDSVRLKPVSPVALTIPSVPKVKPLSPIQRRHPTVVSLLNSKLPLPRSPISSACDVTPQPTSLVVTSPAIVPNVPPSSVQVQSAPTQASSVEFRPLPMQAATTINVPTPPKPQLAAKQGKKPAILGKAKLPAAVAVSSASTTPITAITSVIPTPILIPSVTSVVSPVILPASSSQVVSVTTAGLIVPQPTVLPAAVPARGQPPPYPTSKEAAMPVVQAVSSSPVTSVVSPPPYPHSKHTQLNIPKITPKLSPKACTKKAAKKRASVKSQVPVDKLKALLPQDLSIPRINALDDDLSNVKIIPKALPNASRLQRQLDELNNIEENLRELHQGGEIDLSLKKKYQKMNISSRKTDIGEFRGLATSATLVAEDVAKTRNLPISRKSSAASKTPSLLTTPLTVPQKKETSPSKSTGMHELKARLTFKIQPVPGLEDNSLVNSESRLVGLGNAPVKIAPAAPVHKPKLKGSSDPSMTLADRYMQDWKPTGKFCCKFCHYSSVTQNFLFRHWVMNHSGLRPYMCPFCSLRAPTRDAVMRHQATRHKDSERQILVDNTAEKLLVKRFKEVFDRRTLAGFPDDEHGLASVLPSGIDSFCNERHVDDGSSSSVTTSQDQERTWLYRLRPSEDHSDGDDVGVHVENGSSAVISESEQLAVSKSPAAASVASQPLTTPVVSPTIIKYKLQTVDGLTPPQFLINNNAPVLPVLSPEGTQIPFVMSASQLLAQMKDSALNLQVVTSSSGSGNTLSTQNVTSPVPAALPITQIKVEGRTLPSVVIPSSSLMSTVMSPSKILVSPPLSRLSPSSGEHAHLPVSAVSPEAAANARMTIYNLLERAIMTSYTGEPAAVQASSDTTTTVMATTSAAASDVTVLTDDAKQKEQFEPNTRDGTTGDTSITPGVSAADVSTAVSRAENNDASVSGDNMAAIPTKDTQTIAVDSSTVTSAAESQPVSSSPGVTNVCASVDASKDASKMDAEEPSSTDAAASNTSPESDATEIAANS